MSLIGLILTDAVAFARLPGTRAMRPDHLPDHLTG
jgi:hypothetical protein